MNKIKDNFSGFIEMMQCESRMIYDLSYAIDTAIRRYGAKKLACTLAIESKIFKEDLSGCGVSSFDRDGVPCETLCGR